MTKTIINTADAPQAIGTYSQAVKVDNTVYISGQIPLDPKTGEVVQGGVAAQAVTQTVEKIVEKIVHSTAPRNAAAPR